MAASPAGVAGAGLHAEAPEQVVGGVAVQLGEGGVELSTRMDYLAPLMRADTRSVTVRVVSLSSRA